jgi:hypothetical protein
MRHRSLTVAAVFSFVSVSKRVTSESIGWRRYEPAKTPAGVAGEAGALSLHTSRAHRGLENRTVSSWMDWNL